MTSQQPHTALYKAVLNMDVTQHKRDVPSFRSGLKCLKTTEAPYKRLCTLSLNEPRKVFYK